VEYSRGRKDTFLKGGEGGVARRIERRRRLSWQIQGEKNFKGSKGTDHLYLQKRGGERRGPYETGENNIITALHRGRGKNSKGKGGVFN